MKMLISVITGLAILAGGTMTTASASDRYSGKHHYGNHAGQHYKRHQYSGRHYGHRRHHRVRHYRHQHTRHHYGHRHGGYHVVYRPVHHRHHSGLSTVAGAIVGSAVASQANNGDPGAMMAGAFMGAIVGHHLGRH